MATMRRRGKRKGTGPDRAARCTGRSGGTAGLVVLWGYSLFQWLELVQRELLLFAAAWFVLGALDEVVVDLTWLGLRLRGRGRAEVLVGMTVPN